MSTQPAPVVSVVLATHNRPRLLLDLLDGLRHQTMPADQFEVVVVDDGSHIPVDDVVDPNSYPFVLTLIRQAGAGASSARHHGILRANGEILVIVDDDMTLPPQFLAAHAEHHRRADEHVAVIGRYISPPDIQDKPLFERYHGLKWDQLTERVGSGTITVNGTYLATGNTSMRRQDYLAAGGFDLDLARLEDLRLGLDLERIGVRLVYSSEAGSVHCSDHTDPSVWRGRQHLHGRLEKRISDDLDSVASADPWRYAFSLPMAGRLLCAVPVLTPRLATRLTPMLYAVASWFGRVGLERVAMRGCGVVWGWEFFSGVRQEYGSLRASWAGLRRYVAKAVRSGQADSVPGWIVRRWGRGEASCAG